MGRRSWDSTIVRPCRSAWTPLDGRNYSGETRMFKPLIDLYREAGRRAGRLPDRLKVGIHSLGYVADTTREAVDDFFQAMPCHDRDWKGARMA